MKITCESNDNQVELTDIPGYPSMGVLKDKCKGCKVGDLLEGEQRAVVFDGTEHTMFTCVRLLDKDLLVQLAAARAMSEPKEVIEEIQTKIQENEASDRRFWGEESIQATMNRHMYGH